MASFPITNRLSSTFFLFLVTLLLALSPLPTHARVQKSFSKVLRNEFPSATSTIPQETDQAAAAEEEQPETLPSQRQNGYGLYGRGPDEYFPTRAENSWLPSDESSDKKEANAFYPYEEGNKNKLGSGMSDTRTVENGKYFYDLNEQRHGEAYDPTAKDGRFGHGVYNYDGRSRKGYSSNSQGMEDNQNYQDQEISREEYYDP